MLLATRGDRLPDAIAHAIRQQLRQFDQLRNTQQFLSLRSFQVKRKITAQRVGRGECFAEVDQQVFGIDSVRYGK